MASPNCCTNCSADLDPTEDGKCRRCRTAVSSEQLARLSPAPKAPAARFSSTDRSLGPILKVLFAGLFICMMALTKGFIAIFALPLALLLVIPVLVSTQATTKRRLADGTAPPSMALLADLLVVSACAFYFVMPMAGDGNPTIVYIVKSPGAATLFPFLTAASAIGFLVAAVKFFQLRRPAGEPAK